MSSLELTFTASPSSDTIGDMGKAGKALRQVLETYGISQNKLAVVMGTPRSIVFKWFHEHRDPTAETVVDIAKALQTIEPASAKEFVRLYLGEFLEYQEQPKER